MGFRLSSPAPWVDLRPGPTLTFLLPQLPWKGKQTLPGRGLGHPLTSPNLSAGLHLSLSCLPQAGAWGGKVLWEGSVFAVSTFVVGGIVSPQIQGHLEPQNVTLLERIFADVIS